MRTKNEKSKSDIKRLPSNKIDNLSPQEILRIFESVPGLYLILKPDAPQFTIVAVSDAYAKATMTKRDEIFGKGLFEVFPDNPNDPKATGVKNLTASLMSVLREKKPHRMATQKYDIPKPTSSTFEERYWDPLNVPVLSELGEVIYIVHSVVDVTRTILAEKNEKIAEERATKQEHRADKQEAINQELTQTNVLLQEARNESEQRKKLYEAVTASTLDLIYVFDLNYRFTYANEALLQMWGKKALEEARGKGLRELGYEEWHAKKHEREIDQVVATKKPIRGTVSFPHATLGKRIYDYIFTPIVNAQGEVEAIAGTTRDITELKQTQEALKESEEKFRTMADNIHNLAWMAKPDGYIYWYNKRWHEYTGTKPKDMEGWGWQAVHDPNILPDVLKRWKASIKTGKSFDMIFPLKGSDGIFRPFLTRVEPVKDEEGHILHWFGTNTDITDQVKAEEEATIERNRLHELLMQAPAIMVVLKGEKHVFDLANSLYLKLVGKKKEEIIGKTVAEALPEIVGQGYIELLDTVYKTGKPFIGKEMLSKLDRKGTGQLEEVYLNFIYQPIKDHEGKVQGVFGHAVDVTEQVNARRAIEESEERFRAIWESVSDAIAISDEKGFVISANPAYFKLYGYTPKEVIGKYFYIIFPKDQHEIALRQYHEVFHGEKESNVTEAEVQLANGTRRIVESKYDFINRNGKRIAMVSTIRDITERKALEKQKDEFLGVASHELKTPVTSIKAYGQVLETMFRRKGDIKAAEHLIKMDAQLNKLTNLISDLLDVTKINAGRLQFQEEYFEFNTLIEEMVDELQRTTEKHQLIKQLETSIKVYGDKERIGQVLTNLISNAIKYSPHSKKIIISTKIDHENVVVCVQDFGIGIPKDKQEKVFDQFFRVSGDKEITFPGLGLGLFVSSEIVKRQGGRIWVKSIEHKGSKFCFSLPIEKNHITQQINTEAEKDIQHE